MQQLGSNISPKIAKTLNKMKLIVKTDLQMPTQFDFENCIMLIYFGWIAYFWNLNVQLS